MPPLILVPPYKKNFVSSLTASWTANPNYGGVGKKYAGWIGNASSPLAEGSKFTINIPKTANGVRLVLQAAGGGSSRNDADGDSSANSGATCDLILPPTVVGNIEVLIGSAGGVGAAGNPSYQVSPRAISLGGNPLGDYPQTMGQATYSGSGAYNSAIRLVASNLIIAYAEGGGGTINYDNPYASTSRAWIASSSGLGITGTTILGPVSTGRGTHAGDGNWPNWNFNINQNYRTAYGLADPTSEVPYITSAQYGKGGREATLNGGGEAGKPGFLWMIIL